MKCSSPKLAALTALEQSLLSSGGRRTLERHLAHCEVCKAARPSVRKLIVDVSDLKLNTEAQVHAFNWAPIEQSLSHLFKDADLSAPISPVMQPESSKVVALKTKRSGGLRPMVIGGGILLAAAAVTVMFWPPAPIRPVAVRSPLPANVHVTEFVASLSAGPSAIEVPAVWREGETIVVPPSSRVDAVSDEHVIAALSGGSSATVRSRGLELHQGRVDLKTSGDVPFVVQVGQLDIESVSSAHFFVEMGDGEPTIRGKEGGVRIRNRGTGDLRTLTFNERESQGATDAPAPILPNGLSGPWVNINHPDVVQWKVLDVEVAASQNLSMAVREGPLHIEGYGADGAVYETDVVVGPSGLTLAASALPRRRIPRRLGEPLSADQIQTVVRSGARDLRRCYDLALRQDPTLSGVWSMAVEVSRSGQARAGGFAPTNPPPVLSSCLRGVVGRWEFPQSQSGADFEVPVRFATH